MRRGLPYGPTYDPTKPYDGIERGILFYFINANIENQYEFVLRRWVNDSEFAGAVRLHPQSKDPLIGTQDPAESIFVIPQANGGPPIEVTGLSTFVTTKAAAYVFLPSITAIKFIANVGEGLGLPPNTGVAGGFLPNCLGGGRGGGGLRGASQ